MLQYIAMEAQVDKEHYRFESYGTVARWGSYHYQIRELLACKPQSVLEVGVGDEVVGHYLKTQTDIKYTSIDVAEDLHPDILGSVTEMPCKDNQFDVVCAFEVLEHIPHDEVPTAVGEMARVAKTHLAISVPHFGPPILFRLKLPFLPDLKFAWKIPYPRVHEFKGEHYWELGKKGYPPERFRSLLARYGEVVSEFVPFENQYHHFFIVKLKQ